MRPVVLALAVAEMLLISPGCSRLDFGRPILPLMTDRGTTKRASTAKESQAEAMARSQRMAKALAAWTADVSASADYHVSDEDVLEIGILSLEEPGKVGKIVRAVRADGMITLPWIGSVEVAGLTIQGVEEKIRGELDDKFIKNPEVTVAVTQYLGAPVVLTGAVGKPGVYYLKSDRQSILQLLAEADGLRGDAGK